MLQLAYKWVYLGVLLGFLKVVASCYIQCHILIFSLCDTIINEREEIGEEIGSHARLNFNTKSNTLDNIKFALGEGSVFMIVENKCDRGRGLRINLLEPTIKNHEL